MIAALLLLAAAAGQPNATQAASPKTKQCPDRSVVLATEQCIEYPNHRYLLTHEPWRREFTERWWCGRSERPIEARIVSAPTLSEGGRDSRAPGSRLTYLFIQGQKPSARLLQEVRSKVAGLGKVANVSSRCLDTPKHGTIGVLILTAGRRPYGRLEIELRP